MMPYCVKVCVATALSLCPALDCARAAGTVDGKFIFTHRCSYCHEASTDKTKVGPPLKGVFGRVSGSVPGFKYSEAMKAANIVWDENSLKAYLADPKAYIPNNAMAFKGLQRAGEMELLIPYLMEVTK